jgi:iron complex transport system substrate-binding protein
MRRRLLWLAALAMAADLSGIHGGSAAAAATRIVCLGGSLTEVVYALGKSDAIVGVDTTSLFPPEARKHEQVGYVRTLSAEGILSLRPNLILASSEAGPSNVIEQIKNSGVRVVEIPEERSIEGVRHKIERISVELEATEEGERLAAQLARDEAALRNAIDASKTPMVLFVMTRGEGTLLGAGRDTAADAMIRIAGGRNILEAQTGYKPLNGEAGGTLVPDVIVVGSRTLDACGGIDGLLERAALRLSPAGRAKRVVAMDDLYLLGFGPRTAKAAGELAAALRK